MILSFNLHIIKINTSIDVLQRGFVLTRHAVLCGIAPRGFSQKKINEMHSFLTSAEGGWQEKEITIFPNGVSEPLLSFTLERLKSEKTDYILLYICTESSVSSSEKSVWLGGEKIRRSVVESALANGRGQVIYDCSREVGCEGKENFCRAEVDSLFSVK